MKVFLLLTQQGQLLIKVTEGVKHVSFSSSYKYPPGSFENIQHHSRGLGHRSEDRYVLDRHSVAESHSTPACKIIAVQSFLDYDQLKAFKVLLMRQPGVQVSGDKIDWKNISLKVFKYTQKNFLKPESAKASTPVLSSMQSFAHSNDSKVEIKLDNQHGNVASRERRNRESVLMADTFARILAVISSEIAALHQYNPAAYNLERLVAVQVQLDQRSIRYNKILCYINKMKSMKQFLHPEEMSSVQIIESNLLVLDQRLIELNDQVSTLSEALAAQVSRRQLPTVFQSPPTRVARRLFGGVHGNDEIFEGRFAAHSAL